MPTKVVTLTGSSPPLPLRMGTGDLMRGLLISQAADQDTLCGYV